MIQTEGVENPVNYETTITDSATPISVKLGDYQPTYKKFPTIDYSTFKLCPLRNVECSRRHCAWYDERREWCAVLSMARR